MVFFPGPGSRSHSAKATGLAIAGFALFVGPLAYVATGDPRSGLAFLSGLLLLLYYWRLR